jgi:hypothetical protein
VNVQDIYDEFSDGVFDPNAIHDFLVYTYANWVHPAPTYVLLVGDGNYDYKNYMGSNETNYIPPYLADVDPWSGEIPADNIYVSFSTADRLPDMALGRLPVKTAAEASAVVQKILSYTSNANGDWINKTSFVADDPDSGGNFPASSDTISGLLPENYSVQKIYLPTGVTSTSPEVVQARLDIMSAFNGGRFLIQFTGHSTPYQWTFESLLDTNNVPTLTNANHLPFVVSMTCLTGDYSIVSSPTIDRSSLDETLVRAANGGAIASFSPLGKGLSAGHDILSQGLYHSLFDENVLELGLVTTQAKVYLYANSTSYRDLIDTYLLLGDPAIRLPLTPTAVNLKSFSFHARSPVGILLDWATVQETNTLGFNIYRSQVSLGVYTKLNQTLIPAKNPGGVIGSEYMFDDPGALPGVFYDYKLEHVDSSNNSTIIGFLTARYFNLFLPAIHR